MKPTARRITLWLDATYAAALGAYAKGQKCQPTEAAAGLLRAQLETCRAARSAGPAPAAPGDPQAGQTWRHRKTAELVTVAGATRYGSGTTWIHYYAGPGAELRSLTARTFRRRYRISTP